MNIQPTTMKGHFMNGWLDSEIKKADDAEKEISRLLANLAVSDFPEVDPVKGAIRFAVHMEFFSMDRGVSLCQQADALAKGRREQLRHEAYIRHQKRAK